RSRLARVDEEARCALLLRRGRRRRGPVGAGVAGRRPGPGDSAAAGIAGAGIAALPARGLGMLRLDLVAPVSRLRVRGSAAGGRSRRVPGGGAAPAPPLHTAV